MGFPSEGRAGGCQGSFRGIQRSRESPGRGLWKPPGCVLQTCGEAGEAGEEGQGEGREAGSPRRPQGLGRGVSKELQTRLCAAMNSITRSSGPRLLLRRASARLFLCPSSASPQTRQAVFSATN